MKNLVNRQMKIKDTTRLRINQGEVLTKVGIQIKNKVKDVGVGFGTGRHSEFRKKFKKGEIDSAAVPMPQSILQSNSDEKIKPQKP